MPSPCSPQPLARLGCTPVPVGPALVAERAVGRWALPALEQASAWAAGGWALSYSGIRACGTEICVETASLTKPSSGWIQTPGCHSQSIGESEPSERRTPRERAT